MKMPLLRQISPSLLTLFSVSLVSGAPIAGVFFDDRDPTPQDLELTDSIAVSKEWLFGGTGGISFDANSDTGRDATAPFGKFNGPDATSANPPEVGTEPPLDGVHSFSITIGDSPVTLTNVKFDFSNASPSANQRWLAFRTSLDDNLIYSANGVARPGLVSADVVLGDPKYANLTNTTVEFFWYSGGEGSGDSDIDNIVIENSATVVDTDGDGLPDSYEALIVDFDPDDDMAEVGDVQPGDDFDEDGSTNQNEFEMNTSPVDSDSDDDGYLDGVESNDETFDDIASDTGTDPNDADTDDDGLLDGVESNTGIFVSERDTGSNPLLFDTDSDDFGDAAEVNVHGTNPGDATSAPTAGPNTLFLGGSSMGTTGADAIVLQFLKDNYGLSRVTYQQANATNTGDESDYDLLVLSSTPGSGDFRSKYQDSLTPIVNWEEAISDSSAFGEFGMSSSILIKSTDTTQVTLADHPIAEGLPETLTLFENTGPETTGTADLFPGLQVVATGADGGGIDNVMIFVAEAGDAVDENAGVLDSIAPARRVMLPFTDNTIGSLTEDGFKLFKNSLDWAAGRLGGGVQELTISRIDYDNTSQPGNIIATLIFASKEGRKYAVVSTDDLSEKLGDWQELDDSVVGEDGSTTVEISFNSFGIPVTDERRFFVVFQVE